MPACCIRHQHATSSYICAPVKSQYAVGALQKAHARHCILDITCILSCQRPARGSFPTASTCSSVADAFCFLAATATACNDRNGAPGCSCGHIPWQSWCRDRQLSGSTQPAQSQHAQSHKSSLPTTARSRFRNWRSSAIPLHATDPTVFSVKVATLAYSDCVYRINLVRPSRSSIHIAASTCSSSADAHDLSPEEQ